MRAKRGQSHKKDARRELCSVGEKFIRITPKRNE